MRAYIRTDTREVDVPSKDQIKVRFEHKHGHVNAQLRMIDGVPHFTYVAFDKDCVRLSNSMVKLGN